SSRRGCSTRRASRTCVPGWCREPPPTWSTGSARTGEGMGKVVAQAIMSLDGYVAKQDNTIGRLFDWLQNGEVEIPTPAGDFAVHLSPPSAEHWRRWPSVGALVCGRTLFD